MSTLNCILYVRKSQGVEGNTIEDDLEKQREMLLAIAKNKEYNVIEVFEEVASSIDADRVQFNSMMNMIKKGEIDIVLVSAMDRIARSLSISEKFFSACKEYNVLIETPREVIDLQQGGSELLALIQSIFGKVEHDTIRMRLANGKVDAVGVNSRWIGTGAPFGYVYDKENKKLVPNEKTVHIFRRMVDLALEGNSYAQISKHINKLGYKTKTGKFWDASRVLRILSNRVNLGEAVYNSTTVKRSAHAVDCHEPLLTVDEFNMIVKLGVSRRNYDTRARHGHSKTILDGLVFCGKCKRKTSIYEQRNTPGRQRKTEFYMARNCGQIDTITGIKCDNGGCKTAHLEEELLAFLSNYRDVLENEIVNLQENGSDTTLNILHDKANKLKSQISSNGEGIKRATEAYMERVMDLKEYSKWKNDLLDRNIALEKDLIEINNQIESLDTQKISKNLNNRAKLITDILDNSIESVEEINKSLRLIIKRIEFLKVKGVTGKPSNVDFVLHDII